MLVRKSFPEFDLNQRTMKNGDAGGFLAARYFGSVFVWRLGIAIGATG